MGRLLPAFLMSPGQPVGKLQKTDGSGLSHTVAGTPGSAESEAWTHPRWDAVILDRWPCWPLSQEFPGSC